MEKHKYDPIPMEKIIPRLRMTNNVASLDNDLKNDVQEVIQQTAKKAKNLRQEEREEPGGSLLEAKTLKRL